MRLVVRLLAVVPTLAILVTAAQFSGALPARASAVLATGGYHSCAVTRAGEAYCWGRNGHGQLGDSSKRHRRKPARVSIVDAGVVAISVGRFHSCALDQERRAFCWGNNFWGRLGDGTTRSRNTPVPVHELGKGLTAIAVGEQHSCALDRVGRAFCWGYNGYGQLGDGTTLPRLTPVPVEGLGRGLVALTAGGRHSCAIDKSGRSFCWGANDSGQLGDGTRRARQKPVAVSELGPGVTAIAAGGLHTCALDSERRALCWGSNQLGQLGVGGNKDRRVPVRVRGLDSSVRTVAAGLNRTCAVNGDGRVFCWGWNSVAKTLSSTPERVALGGSNIGVAVGEDHSCGLKSSGRLFCWGRNSLGQLGDGTRQDRADPVRVRKIGPVGAPPALVAMAAAK